MSASGLMRLMARDYENLTVELAQQRDQALKAAAAARQRGDR